MSDANTPRQRLIELISELSVVHGEVTLSSGIKANYYVDLRKATLHHEASKLIGSLMLEMLQDNGIRDIDAVGGLTMGADPVAAAIMNASENIDAFVVRKAAKEHGMGRRVEGPEIAGRKVVVVEDTSTTGGSPLTAAEAVKEAGAEILCIATVVDRDTGAREVIEKAGYTYLSLISLEDLGLA